MMKRKVAVRVTLLVLVGLLVLTACNSGGGPAVDSLRNWLQALADLNFKQVMELTCSTPRVRDQVQQKLDPFIDIQETLQALKGQFDFTGLKFEEMSNDGHSARIRVSGTMLLKALGQNQAYELYETVTVVNEADAWRICNNAASLLK
jgi:hypothetical protein